MIQQRFAARVFEQHPAPREAHHHAERILVRRRHEDQLRRMAQIAADGAMPSSSTGIAFRSSPDTCNTLRTPQ